MTDPTGDRLLIHPGSRRSITILVPFTRDEADHISEAAAEQGAPPAHLIRTAVLDYLARRDVGHAFTAAPFDRTRAAGSPPNTKKE